MLRSLALVLVAFTLVAPSALALASPRDEVSIAYAANAGPLVLAAGDLHAEGQARVGTLAALLDESRIGPVPRLSIGERANGSVSLLNVSDATIVIHSGNLMWLLEEATVPLEVTVPYGFGLALPRSPFDDEAGPASPALVLAAPVLRAELSWAGGATDLLPLDATVSVLGADGRPVAGWDRRDVNFDLDARSAESGEGVALRAEGAFVARLTGQALITGLGASRADLALDVQPSDEDRFTETVEAMDSATGLLAGGDASGAGLSGPDSPMQQLAPLSGFLNGAIILMTPPGDGQGGGEEAPEALEARIGSDTLETGAFTLLRSKDLALAWGDDQMRVRGTPTVAVTQQGFHVDAPLTLGLVPLLALAFWLAAVGAVVYFILRRPPASKGILKHRIASTLVYVVVLALVFLYWDASFADTFGTSILTLLRQDGLDGSSYTQLALVFGLETIPWTLAALLFALPVRIAVGVALRYRGQGSSYKGLAKAAGLVSLAIFGPLYALWIVNVLIQQAMRMMPNLMG